jgi:hypothetical protein
MSSTDIDEALFQTITALIDGQRDVPLNERRDADRHSYRCVQLVAPYDGENLPDQQSFRQVLCHDLSANGFSFFSYRTPETPQLIIALGKVPVIRFFIAEVKRVHASDSHHGNEYHVGCRFTRRLENTA